MSARCRIVPLLVLLVLFVASPRVAAQPKPLTDSYGDPMPDGAIGQQSQQSRRATPGRRPGQKERAETSGPFMTQVNCYDKLA